LGRILPKGPLAGLAPLLSNALGCRYGWPLSTGHTATLDGTLQVTLINGYTPTTGYSISIMTFDSETGMFAALTGDGSLFTANYDDPTDVKLVAN
jgi:hypothetical protein